MTNRFINELYDVAKVDFEKGSEKSLTSAYAHATYTYLRAIESAEANAIIRDTIRSLHTYYCQYTSSIGLDEFIARIVSQIVPQEFYDVMGSRERDSILRDLVKNTTLIVGKRALVQDILSQIIDNRGKGEVAIETLRRIGRQAIIDFKASLIAKLYKKEGGEQRGGHVVAREIYDKVKEELQKTLVELVQMEVIVKNVKSENKRLREQLQQAGNVIAAARQQLQQRVLVAAPQVPAIPAAPQVQAIPAAQAVLAVPTVPAISQTSAVPVVAAPAMPVVATSQAEPAQKPAVEKPQSAEQIRDSLLKIPPGLMLDETESADDFATATDEPMKEEESQSSEGSSEESDDEDTHKRDERARRIAEKNRKSKH